MRPLRTNELRLRENGNNVSSSEFKDMDWRTTKKQKAETRAAHEEKRVEIRRD